MAPAQRRTQNQAQVARPSDHQGYGLIDAFDNLVRFALLPGQRHDITAFDAHWLREQLQRRNIDYCGTRQFPDEPGSEGNPTLLENALMRNLEDISDAARVFPRNTAANARHVGQCLIWRQSVKITTSNAAS
jgi:hypothetical protein